MLKYVEEGRSAWFSLDANGLDAAVQATLEVTRRRFPNPATIPFHSRWRHFEAGGRDRWGALAGRLEGLPAEEIARRCGFGTGKNLRAAFARILQASPKDFRPPG